MLIRRFGPLQTSAIQVDASNKDLGAALIVFASKSLTRTDQRYANIKKRTISSGFREPEIPNIYSHIVIFESDRKPLKMISLKNLTTRLQ